MFWSIVLFIIIDVIFIKRGIEIMSGYNRILHKYIYYDKNLLLCNSIYYEIKADKSFILMEMLK